MPFVFNMPPQYKIKVSPWDYLAQGLQQGLLMGIQGKVQQQILQQELEARKKAQEQLLAKELELKGEAQKPLLALQLALGIAENVGGEVSQPAREQIKQYLGFDPFVIKRKVKEQVTPEYEGIPMEPYTVEREIEEPLKFTSKAESEMQKNLLDLYKNLYTKQFEHELKLPLEMAKLISQDEYRKALLGLRGAGLASMQELREANLVNTMTRPLDKKYENLSSFVSNLSKLAGDIAKPTDLAPHIDRTFGAFEQLGAEALNLAPQVGKSALGKIKLYNTVRSGLGDTLTAFSTYLDKVKPTKEKIISGKDPQTFSLMNRLNSILAKYGGVLTEQDAMAINTNLAKHNLGVLYDTDNQRWRLFWLGGYDPFTNVKISPSQFMQKQTPPQTNTAKDVWW